MAFGRRTPINQLIYRFDIYLGRAVLGGDRRTNVTTPCIGALFFGKATGYEINKMFVEGPFARFLDAGYGSIYPALTRLTEEGKVTCEAAPQDGRPDKKIHSLTEAFSDA